MVTASHRSVIALRKAAESVCGKALVCGRAPAPGATGSEAGDGVALARGTALPGLAGGWAATIRSRRHWPWWAGGDATGEPAPHPASRAAAISVAASGARRDNLMPPPRHLAFSF